MAYGNDLNGRFCIADPSVLSALSPVAYYTWNNEHPVCMSVSVCMRGFFLLLLIAPFHPLVHVSVLNRNASLTFSTIYHRRRDIVSYLCQSLFSLLHTPCVCELQATHTHTDTQNSNFVRANILCTDEAEKAFHREFSPERKNFKKPRPFDLPQGEHRHTHTRARTPHSLCENPSALCLVQV